MTNAGLDENFADVFERVRHSVLSVHAGAARGSAFVVTDNGIAATNAHVIGYAREVRVRTPTTNERSATVIHVDVPFDLALLVVKDPPPPLPMSSLARVRVGEPVLAVGDPLGLPASATKGIVSSKSRVSRTTGLVHIQTDAALNPGNSGGPLVDARGHAIGVNTLVHARGESLGFAVPIDAVDQALRFLVDHPPTNPPTLVYACRTCRTPHEPATRWCPRCGGRTGFSGSLDDVRRDNAASLVTLLLGTLGYDAGVCAVGDGVWRIVVQGAEVFIDVVGGGRALSFSSRLGVLPMNDPLPVMRFLAAANDRSVGPCRLVLDGRVIVLELLEPTEFPNIATMTSALQQMLSLAGTLTPLLASQFGVEQALHRFVDVGPML